MRKIEASSEQYAVDVLSKAEEILQTSRTDHRFVGGVITNPLTLATTVFLDAPRRTVQFQSHKPHSLVRTDGSIRDIDVIGFSRFTDSYEEARRLLKEEAVKYKSQNRPYPPISIEPTHYSNWPGRNRLLQFVSTLDTDQQWRLHLTFGAIDQLTTHKTFEPWQITFDGGLKLTSINPYGLPKRYWMRNASGLKKKDLASEEITLGTSYSKLDILYKIADTVRKQGLAQGEDYKKLYETWDQFIDTLINHPDPLTRAKAIVTKLYWNTIGTALAHGTGLLKPFASWGDKFTG